MAQRIFKIIWFVSVMAVLGVLLYIYASLPETILLGDQPDGLQFSRSVFFYSAVGILAILNSSTLFISRLYPAQAAAFKAWYFGMVAVINLFFIVSMAFISVSNGSEKFDYESIGTIIYGVVALVLIWLVAWPIYRIINALLAKNAKA